MMTKRNRKKPAAAPALKLDLGCGKNKREGFTGVDCRQFEGVDVVVDLRAKMFPVKFDLHGNVLERALYRPWPWKDSSVDEVHCSHFVEHLTADERIHFVNELHRVLKPGAKAQIIVPHWNSHRAYGDLTHQWPPVSEMWFFYLNKGWRAVNAPHNDGYNCDFDATWGYSLRQDLFARNEEYRQYAVSNFKDAAQDILATLTKKK
jgi:SAM-dependent methyltransferase